MRKRIAILCLAMLMVCGLCACGNQSGISGNQGQGWGHLTFQHVHFNDGVTGVCADVESWYDYKVGCEVLTKEYGALLLSEGTYILIESSSTCPFCDKNE